VRQSRLIQISGNPDRCSCGFVSFADENTGFPATAGVHRGLVSLETEIRMRLDWRTVFGPVLTAGVVTAIFLVDRQIVAVPDPASLCIGAVVLSAAIGGTGPGVVSAVVSILFIALIQTQHGPLSIGEIAARTITIGLPALAVAIAIGVLRSRSADAVRRERERHTALERLSGALDEMDIGVVLLDSDTRAQFINRAFRRMFILSDDQANNKPPFVALVYHGRDTGAYELPEEELGPYVSRRIAQVRSGDPTPIDLKLTNGQVLRFRCAAMPDGGRMLTYMPITDLIRHTDDPADREALLAQRMQQDGAERIARHTAGTLRAAE
jgi:PAS domain-containing protein